MSRLTIDPYIFDTLMRDLTGHDRQPSAFLVYLHLYRWTAAIGKATHAESLSDIAKATGLSRRSVQSAVSRLHERRLISIERAGITQIPRYAVRTPWRD